MRKRTKHQFIADIDDNEYEECPESYQTLSESVCMFCEEQYDITEPVIIHLSDTEGILWWHREHKK